MGFEEEEGNRVLRSTAEESGEVWLQRSPKPRVEISLLEEKQVINRTKLDLKVCVNGKRLKVQTPKLH